MDVDVPYGRATARCVGVSTPAYNRRICINWGCDGLGLIQASGLLGSAIRALKNPTLASWAAPLRRIEQADLLVNLLQVAG